MNWTTEVLPGLLVVLWLLNEARRTINLHEMEMQTIRWRASIQHALDELDSRVTEIETQL